MRGCGGWRSGVCRWCGPAQCVVCAQHVCTTHVWCVMTPHPGSPTIGSPSAPNRGGAVCVRERERGEGRAGLCGVRASWRAAGPDAHDERRTAHIREPKLQRICICIATLVGGLLNLVCFRVLCVFKELALSRTPPQKKQITQKSISLLKEFWDRKPR